MSRHLIERFSVDSSTIKSIGYEDGVCVVEFTNGHLFAYPMEPGTFEMFAHAESKGRHFNREIRGKVSGEKLTGMCAACGLVPAVIVEPCPACGGTVRMIDSKRKEDR